MHERKQAKLGFIHIPKTAGTTINDNLGRVLCPEHVHIRALYKSNYPEVSPSKFKGRIKVQFESNFHNQVKERDWVAGHISALSMAEFGREFTFSVFRDRKVRALSQYRFMRWRWDAKNKSSQERIGIPPDISFSDWLVRFTALSNETRYGHNLILGPKFNQDLTSSKTDLSNDWESSREVPLEPLSNIDRVYFPNELQEVLDDLAEEGLAPPIKIEKSSRITQESKYKKSEPELILELLNSKSKPFDLETSLFNAAKTQFAKYWTGKEIDDSEFLSLCEEFKVI